MMAAFVGSVKTQRSVLNPVTNLEEYPYAIAPLVSQQGPVHDPRTVTELGGLGVWRGHADEKEGAECDTVRCCLVRRNNSFDVS